MAYLTQFSNSVPVIKFPIDQLLMSIGQDFDMDICVAEDGIAEKHAIIEVTRQDQAFHFVVKPMSGQTIQLNGEAVLHAVLKDGDWLLLGDIEFQFTDDGVNEIKQEKVLSISATVPEPVKVAEVAEAPKDAAANEEAPAVKLMRENRINRRLNRF